MNGRVSKMRRGKWALYKTLFIVATVIVMVGIEQLLALGFHVEHHMSTIMLLSGSVWAFIANVLFDKIAKRKEMNQIDAQLHEVLRGLQELKDIINK